MKRKADRPLKKHTIKLFEGQFDELGHFHSRPGPSEVIRRLIDAHLQRLRSEADQRLTPVITGQPTKIEEILE